MHKLFSDKQTLLSTLIQCSDSSDKGIYFINDAHHTTFLSYRELLSKSFTTLGHLQNLGVKEGDEAIIVLEDNQQFVIVFWACVIGKVIPVPVAYADQKEYKSKIRNILNSLKNPSLIAKSATLGQLTDFFSDEYTKGQNSNVSVRTIAIHDILREGNRGQRSSPSADDLAYIQYSSGSTGSPKGIMLTNRNLITNINDIVKSSGTTETDSMLSWMPLYHDMGLIGVHLTAVTLRIDQYLMSHKLFVRDPLLWLEKASAHKITQLYSPNFGFHYLLNSSAKDKKSNCDLSNLRIIYNGAEPISARLIEKFLDRFADFKLGRNIVLPVYGLAEASLAVSIPPPNSEIVIHYLDRRKLNVGSKVSYVSKDNQFAVAFVDVGYAVESCSLRICDDHDENVSEGMIGHIQVIGNNVTSGYYNNEENTCGLFSKDGWLCTGDLGFIKNHRLTVTGRFKNVIIINGQNYYTQDLENIIHEIPGAETGKSIACGIPSEITEQELLIIFVSVKRLGAEFDNMTSAIKEKIFKDTGLVVHRVVPVKKFPKTTSGKIQNFKLVEAYILGEFDEATDDRGQYLYKKSGVALPDQLSEILSHLTGVKSDRLTPLFSSGISSIVATQFVSQINWKLGYQPSITDIFNSKNCIELAGRLTVENDQLQPDILEPVLGTTEYLTVGQRGIWIADQLRHDGQAYNIGAGFVFTGIIDIQRIENAFAAIVDRHDSLRTYYTTRNGKPIARHVSFDDCQFKVTVTSLADHPDPGAMAELLLKKEIDTQFDLAEPPLIRVNVYQLSAQKSVLGIVLHHIISDGWSLEVILNELTLLYNRPDSNIPELNLRYQDFVNWHIRHLSSSKASANLTYWTNKLKGAPRLELPFYGSTNDGDVFTGGSLTIELPLRIVSLLDSYCQNKRITRFKVLTTIINILLYRYTGEKDIIIGTDAAGRTHPSFENQVGYFLNTLFLRTSVSSDSSLNELIVQISTDLDSAIDHQHYCIEQLAETLNDDAVPAGAPLFNVLVLYQHFQSSLRLSQLKQEQFIYLTPNAHLVDLQFDFFEISTGLSVCLKYNSRIVDVGLIETMVNHFQTIAMQVLENPNQLVREIALLNQEEKQELRNFNRKEVQLEKKYSFSELFSIVVSQYPAEGAVSFENRLLTFSEIDILSNRILHYLRKEHKIKRGDRVGLVMENSDYLITSTIAFLKGGIVLVPMDSRWPVDRINYIIKDCGLRLIITNAVFSNLNQILCESVYFPDDLTRINSLPPETLEAECAPSIEDLAYIMYTSGSEGYPKGVMVGHTSLMDYARTFKAFYNISRHDRVIQQSSPAFDTFFEEVVPTLCSGALLLIIKNGARNIEGILEAIYRQYATVISTTPMVIAELNNYAVSINSLRLIISGGDVLKSEYISNLIETKNVYNTYGPTEGTICATYYKVLNPWLRQIIGKPIANKEIFIVDKDFNEVPIGVPGELCIGGEGIALGYLRQFDEKFLVNPFDSLSRLYRTGDRCRWLKDGNIEFLGRGDKQSKFNGYRIELGEIEKVLATYPYVQDATVFICEENSVLYLAACIVSSLPISETDLQMFMANKLPYYMLPATYLQLKQFPITSQGKMDKNKLLSLVLKRRVDIELKPPETKTERSIVAIWQEVFERDISRVNINFFEIGGNSIKAMRVIARIKDVFNVVIDYKTIFNCPTILELGVAIDSAAKTNRVELKMIPRQEVYSTSNAQKRIWILQSLDPQLTAYNIHSCLCVKEHLDIRHFEKAFQILIRQHEILRTNFVEVDGEPWQKIHSPKLEVNLDYFDLSGKEDSADTMDKDISLKIGKSFDLEKDRLLRLSVYRLKDDEFVISFVIHHIISDGWSMENITREMFEVYNAFFLQKKIRLAPPTYQYKEYQAWLGENQNHTKAKNYWRKIFLDGVSPVDLTYDFPRPQLKTHNGAAIVCKIGSEIKKDTERIARSNNTTIFAVLVALVKTLLYKYSNQKDITIGIPVSGRHCKELESQIGLYVNTLALKTCMNPQASLVNLIKQIGDGFVESYEYQTYPFDKLVQDIPLTWDKSRSPFFDVMVVMNDLDAYAGTVQFSGLNVELMRDHRYQCQTKFDLTFNFNLLEEDIELVLEYNTDLFVRERITRMMDHFLKISKDINRNLTKAICDINVLPESENTLLQHYEGRLKTANKERVRHVLDLIALKTADSPLHVAIESEGRRMTYQKLDEESSRVAAQLQKLYLLKSGDRVAIFLPRTEPLIIAIMAVLKTGAAYVPLDTKYPKERIGYILADSEPKVIITDTDSKIEKLAGSDAPKFNIHNEHGEELRAFSMNESEQLSHLAYLIYTSGSTGKPKGVKISHLNLASFISWSMEEFRNSKFDIVFAATSVCFDLSVFEIFFTLAMGKTIQFLDSGLQIAEGLQTDQRILVNTVPSLIAELLKNKVDISNVSVLNMAGESIPEYFLKLLDCDKTEIRNLYGPSESTTYSTCWKFQTNSKSINIGRPITGTMVLILDNDFKISPIGVAGQIAIYGDGLSEGYLNQDTLTNEKFIVLPEITSQRIYLTGDLGKWLHDGNLTFLGRLDSQVKLRGFRIELEEIEHACLQLNGIIKAIALVQQLDNGQTEIILYYTTSASYLDQKTVKNYLLTVLPHYMIPALVVLLDEFPMTLNGKINRKLLKIDGSQQELHDFIYPKNETEKVLTQIWKDILDQKNVSVEGNFFALGGNSMMVIKLAHKINKFYPSCFKATDVFTYSTIRQIADLIESRTHTEVLKSQFEEFEL